jgi:GxxExxY protein
MTLTGKIIGAALEVHTSLGPGFLESIYKHALLRECQLRALLTQTEVEVPVSYKGFPVGKHCLDLVVDELVVVELKAVNAINDVHKAQTISYLAATGLEVALILNFGAARLLWKRLIKSRECRELRELI